MTCRDCGNDIACSHIAAGLLVCTGCGHEWHSPTVAIRIELAIAEVRQGVEADVLRRPMPPDAVRVSG